MASGGEESEGSNSSEDSRPWMNDAPEVPRAAYGGDRRRSFGGGRRDDVSEESEQSGDSGNESDDTVPEAVPGKYTPHRPRRAEDYVTPPSHAGRRLYDDGEVSMRRPARPAAAAYAAVAAADVPPYAPATMPRARATPQPVPTPPPQQRAPVQPAATRPPPARDARGAALPARSPDPVPARARRTVCDKLQRGAFLAFALVVAVVAVYLALGRFTPINESEDAAAGADATAVAVRDAASALVPAGDAADASFTGALVGYAGVIRNIVSNNSQLVLGTALAGLVASLLLE